jgi:hypothetical protein
MTSLAQSTTENTEVKETPQPTTLQLSTAEPIASPTLSAATTTPMNNNDNLTPEEARGGRREREREMELKVLRDVEAVDALLTAMSAEMAAVQGVRHVPVNNANDDDNQRNDNLETSTMMMEALSVAIDRIERLGSDSNTTPIAMAKKEESQSTKSDLPATTTTTTTTTAIATTIASVDPASSSVVSESTTTTTMTVSASEAAKSVENESTTASSSTSSATLITEENFAPAMYFHITDDVCCFPISSHAISNNAAAENYNNADSVSSSILDDDNRLILTQQHYYALPQDILLIIIGHFNTITRLRLLSLISRAFYNAVTDSFGFALEINNLRARWCRLLALRLPHVPRDLTLYHNLKCAVVKAKKVEPSLDFLTALVKKKPSNERPILSVSLNSPIDLNFAQHVAPLISLTSLSLCNTKVTQHRFNDISRLQNLQSFKLTSNTRVTSFAPLNLCTQLRSISLYNTLVDNDSAEQMMKTLPNLDSLSLCVNPRLRGMILISVCRCCHFLISFCGLIFIISIYFC